MNVLTKRISALMEYDFSIPVYQRGYRWDDQQISDLLDDLFEFSASPKTSYYCLQPIVVKQREDGAYDVLDGQQRLTTIYILLSYLYPVRQILHKATCDQLYRLKFDQRDDDYLNEKRFRNDTMAEYKTDINKFYIWKAYEAIDLWFKSKGDCESQIFHALLGQQDTEEKHVTKVIWYDVSQSTDSSIDIFTRLNYGKIPLTNAELIKALLLICDHYPAEQILIRREIAVRMSVQWDEMEHALHDPFVWGMIASSEHNKQARIEILINKVARDIKRQDEGNYKHISEDKEYFEYHIVNRYLELHSRTAETVDAFWQKVQDAFTVVRNWAADRDVYHYLGYLSYLTEWNEKDKKEKTKKVNAFIDKWFDIYLDPATTKETFIKQLCTEIGMQIRVTDLSELSYEGDQKALIKILLLYNVEQARKRQSERMLYPFQLQKEQNITSLEHIHPQNLDTDFANTEADFQGIVLPWLESKEYFLKGEDAEMCKQYQDYAYFSAHFEDVKKFIEKIDRHFRDVTQLTDDEMHSIRNMAIVSKEVNSALSNGFMAEKREKLKEKEEKGLYTPPATWMVFNKSFTTNPSNLTFWQKEDRENYYDAIQVVYRQFTEPKKQAEGQTEK